MKKIMVLALVLALALSTMGALAATPGELVGVWYLQTRADSYSVYYDLSQDTLELKRDSTAVLTMDGTEYTYTWETTDEGAMLTAPDDAEYAKYQSIALTDGTLTINAELGTDEYYYDYVFTREPFVIDIPAKKPAEVEDDFYGSWTAVYSIEPNGLFYIPDGFFYHVEISFAQVIVSRPDSEDAVIMTNYADGTLTFPGEELSYDYDAVSVQLTDNGGLVATLTNTEKDVSIDLYFVPADGEIAPEPAPAEEPPAEAETDAAEEEAGDETVLE